MATRRRNSDYAFIRVPEDSDVAVGDVLGLRISYPCGAFDRRRFVPVVTERYDIFSGVTIWL